MFSIKSIVVSSVLAAAVTGGAGASIISTSGMATQIVPPASCLPGALVGPPAYCWNEQANVTASALGVNLTGNGVYTGWTPNFGVISGQFDSHFIHFDALAGVANVTGTVTFSSSIVGVVYDESLLSATDAMFGAGGTAYPTGNFFRSMSGNMPGMSTIGVAGNTLSFDLWAMQPGNYLGEIRVFTHSVPTPGSLALLGLGGLLCARRRSR
jgi:hypothetical protein